METQRRFAGSVNQSKERVGWREMTFTEIDRDEPTVGGTEVSEAGIVGRFPA